MQEEQKFARALANPVKNVRDKTILELKKYLLSIDNMPEIDMLKLWKALYYCLWLADKVPVQEELCISLADLIGVFKKRSFAFNVYLRIFFRTILREWQNLDQHRLNKFYMLFRIMLNKSFTLMNETNWPEHDLSIFLDVLSTEVLQKQPNGPRFHLCDIFLPELLEVTGGNLASDKYMDIIAPFISSLSTTDESVFHNRISQKLFVDYCENFARERRAETCTGDEPAPAVFRSVSSVQIQRLIFDVASGETCSDRYRKKIYNLHSMFQKLTRVTVADDAEVERDISSMTTSNNGKKSKKSAIASESPVPLTPAIPTTKESTTKQEKIASTRIPPATAIAPPVPPSTPVANATPAKFISSPKFAGAKGGYAFKKGPQGVGYYLDKRSKTSPVSSTISPSSVDTEDKKRKAETLVTPPSRSNKPAEEQSGKEKKRDKKKGKLTVAVEDDVDDDSSAAREAKRVRFGKPHSKDYQRSVEGLRSAAPDLSSTPSKGVLVKKNSALASRVATPGAKKNKQTSTVGNSTGSGSPRPKAAQYF